MLWDGSRMDQDGLKDHPGDFPGCGVSEFQDAPGCVQGWPRMALRIVLGIFLDAVWMSSRMLQDGSRMA